MLAGVSPGPSVAECFFLLEEDRLIKGAESTKCLGRKQHFGEKNRIQILLVNWKGEEEKQTEEGKYEKH